MSRARSPTVSSSLFSYAAPGAGTAGHRSTSPMLSELPAVLREILSALVRLASRLAAGYGNAKKKQRVYFEQWDGGARSPLRISRNLLAVTLARILVPKVNEVPSYLLCRSLITTIESTENTSRPHLRIHSLAGRETWSIPWS
jgi:hypothetical protein